ncbi:MAG: helix-turn-helix transcriptional regulator [Phascolarctobacterium sp.]|uniref:helix-turn-helix domain-containing protein n=1 Tax=Phascolarctobacterium sp. TaxID=2049039 RepID=UPI0025D9D1EC|nr:helix-turn-helix transcriptional regulator [Phascolarctobacterium sp.]MCC8157840.1 helix-turn-helix transcriptional regulator [Phascolarctobacterium sp.]
MIGEMLKKTRLIYGFKAGEISELLGISKSYLSEIENDKKKPSLDLLKKYAEIYDIKLSSLILLSESLEEAKKAGKNTVFIQKLLINIINGFYNFRGKEL